MSNVLEEVRSLYKNHYRLAKSRWAGGENAIEVVMDRSSSVSVNVQKVYHKKNTWSGTNLMVRVQISPTWRKTVRDRGLAVLDGMLTTHAKLVARHDDIVVYAASWVRQGRGLFAQCDSGFIAIHGPSNTSYHLVGGNAKQAISRLRRTLTYQAIPQEVRNERA
jgi:hypothetical protein